MTEAAMASGDMVGQQMQKAMDNITGLKDPKNWTAGKMVAGLGSILFASVFIVLTIYLA